MILYEYDTVKYFFNLFQNKFFPLTGCSQFKKLNVEDFCYHSFN